MQPLDFSMITTVPTPALSGYDLIALGDWSGLIAQYGLRSVIIAIVAFVCLRLYRRALEEYYAKKRKGAK